MPIFCEYNACYHSSYEFSPLVCYYTKVHIYTLFSVYYVLDECLIFYNIKKMEINYLILTLVDDLKD